MNPHRRDHPHSNCRYHIMLNESHNWTTKPIFNCQVTPKTLTGITCYTYLIFRFFILHKLTAYIYKTVFLRYRRPCSSRLLHQLQSFLRSHETHVNAASRDLLFHIHQLQDRHLGIFKPPQLLPTLSPFAIHPTYKIMLSLTLTFSTASYSIIVFCCEPAHGRVNQQPRNRHAGLSAFCYAAKPRSLTSETYRSQEKVEIVPDKAADAVLKGVDQPCLLSVHDSARSPSHNHTWAQCEAAHHLSINYAVLHKYDDLPYHYTELLVFYYDLNCLGHGATATADVAHVLTHSQL